MKVNSRRNRRRRLFPLVLLLAVSLLLPLLGLEQLKSETDGSGPPDLEAYPWAYLRNGRPLEPGERIVSLLAVGDIMLGRGVPAEPEPLTDAAGWLRAADVTMGNLENVLLESGIPRQAPDGEAQPILLSAAPASARALRRAGFDILGVANNHSLDYGVLGLEETDGHLQRAGLEIIGTTTEDGASEPLYLEIDGLRLAFLAINAVPDPNPLAACPSGSSCRPMPTRWDPVEAAASIVSAEARADAVIVSIHWGFEYEPWRDPSQENMARIMLEAGTDLIIGHHPHVAQAIAVSGEGVTAYSLGNFVFDQGTTDTSQGLALRAYFDRDGLRGVQALPIRSGTRPRLLSPSEGDALLARVLPPPSRVGFTCDESDCSAVAVPQSARSGWFNAGKIDLTGDGLPETVRREGERISIFENGSAVWQSPPEWRVIDVSLGDPNDDGRYEIMLAIWQKDEAGYERSQPYIVGHRGGEYTLLWGGRPVVDPIQELAVGDVDGDGSDELVVIEEKYDGSSQAVSVWRWSGWTFSLVWRSQPGRYRELILIKGDQPRFSAVAEGI